MVFGIDMPFWSIGLACFTEENSELLLVPSRVNVPGNSKADKAVNQATMTKTVCRPYLPLLLQNGSVTYKDLHR